MKNSSSELSSKLLQTLKKVLMQESGSVTFVFKQERVANIHTPRLKDMEVITTDARQHLNLSKECFLKDSSTKKSPEEFLNMIKTIQWDLGATYFILD